MTPNYNDKQLIKHAMSYHTRIFAAPELQGHDWLYLKRMSHYPTILDFTSYERKFLHGCMHERKTDFAKMCLCKSGGTIEKD